MRASHRPPGRTWIRAATAMQSTRTIDGSVLVELNALVGLQLEDKTDEFGESDRVSEWMTSNAKKNVLVDAMQQATLTDVFGRTPIHHSVMYVNSLTIHGNFEFADAWRILSRLEHIRLLNVRVAHMRRSVSDPIDCLRALQLTNMTPTPSTLASVFACAQGLRALTLSNIGSGLGDELPSNIGTLSQLQSLELRLQTMSTLPASISRLRLRSLYIVNCSLLTTLPLALFDVTTLQELTVIGSLTELQADIRRLTSLRLLTMFDAFGTPTQFPSASSFASVPLEMLVVGEHTMDEDISPASAFPELRIVRVVGATRPSDMFTRVPTIENFAVEGVRGRVDVRYMSDMLARFREFWPRAQHVRVDDDMLMGNARGDQELARMRETFVVDVMG